MTIELTKKFDDGSEWGVTSSGFRLNEPCIMVPITSLANMDDVEIYATVCLFLLVLFVSALVRTNLFPRNIHDVGVQAVD